MKLKNIALSWLACLLVMGNNVTNALNVSVDTWASLTESLRESEPIIYEQGDGLQTNGQENRWLGGWIDAIKASFQEDGVESIGYKESLNSPQNIQTIVSYIITFIYFALVLCTMISVIWFVIALIIGLCKKAEEWKQRFHFKIPLILFAIGVWGIIITFMVGVLIQYALRAV